MDTKKEFKYKETLFLILGSLLLIIALILFHYEKILEVNNEIYNLIQSKIYKENTSLNSIFVNVNVNYLENDEEIIIDNEETTPNYIAFLEIPSINLKQGLLSKTSYYNNVNYHVEILDISDMPDVIDGNLILAGHSGTSNLAYFKNLYKLDLDDTANIYYKSKVYKYSIVNIYKENKDGSINIIRNLNKTTLTLITCTKDDKTKQTIYILELIGVESY